MKLLLPLLALPFFLTACSSTDGPRRELWASSSSDYSSDYREAEGQPARRVHRQVWGEPSTMGYADANATRRNLYSPSVASGPYTRSLGDRSWQENGKPVDEEMKDRREQQRVNAMQTKAPAAAPAPVLQ